MEQVVRISMLLGSENKQSVVCEALLTELEEAITTNGKPFVKGTLMDGTKRVMFKHWDITLSDMLKKYNLPEKRSMVAQVSGLLDFYEGEPQVIVKGGITLVTREGAIDNYIDMPPYPVAGMQGMVNKIVANIEPEELRAVAETMLNMDAVKDKIGYQPLSCDCHSEKAGWLHHVYNLLALSSSEKGEPKRAFHNENGTIQYISCLDKEVCTVAFVVYALSSFYLLNADPDTGCIEEKNTPVITMYGGLHGLKGVIDIHEIIKNNLIGTVSRLRMENLAHCVSVLNGCVEPCTPEGFYCKNLVTLEKQTYKCTRVCETIGYGEKANFSIDGEKFVAIRPY